MLSLASGFGTLAPKLGSGALPEDIVVYHSRTRLILLIAGSLMFVVVGYWLASGTGVAPVIGWLSIAFFGSCGIYALWRLVRRTPALIISSDGIIDRATVNAVGLVPWSQIRDVKILSFLNQKFLGVFVADPAAFIARHSMFKRKALQANLSIGGAPVAIPRAGLAMDLEKLETLIRSRWAAESQSARGPARGQQ